MFVYSRTCLTMTSSTMASVIGAALTVLALTEKISAAVSMIQPSAPSGKANETGIDGLLHLLKDGKLTDFEQLMRTPVPFASNAHDTKTNSSPKIRSGKSLGERVIVPPRAQDFDWVEFSPEGIEEQQLAMAHHHRARSLTKLKELQCTAEEYPLVTIIDGTYVQIMSPNYPNVYPNNIRCGWKILTDPDYVIRVLCPVFQLGQGDFTLAKDYANTTNLRFDASSPMKNVTTVSNKMFIGFKSDSEGEERWSGFTCLARSLPRPQPAQSESPVGKVTDAAELEVPDFKKRFGQPFTAETNKTTTKDIVEQLTISSVSELQVTEVPALSLMSMLPSSSDGLSSPSAITGQVTAVLALSSESLPSSSRRGPSLHSVITGEYLLGLKKKAEEKGIKPTSVWINKPYAQIDQIKTYTVRRGSNTYATDLKE